LPTACGFVKSSIREFSGHGRGEVVGVMTP